MNMIPQQDAIEVFATVENVVAIRQLATPCTDEQVVLVAPCNIEILIDMLRTAKNEADEGGFEVAATTAKADTPC